MAALLPVGMPLAQALNAASGVTTGEVRGRESIDVRERVERGDTLSSALAEHPQLLLAAVCRARPRRRAQRRRRQLVRAPLATQLERDEQLRGRVSSRRPIYPLLLARAGTVAVTVLMFFVLPRFVTSARGERREASRPRRARCSRFPRAAPLLAGAAPVAASRSRRWRVGRATRTKGRRALSSTLLTLPLVKTLRQYALAGALRAARRRTARRRRTAARWRSMTRSSRWSIRRARRRRAHSHPRARRRLAARGGE